MQIKFIATSQHFNNTITGKTVNGIDLSEIPADTKIQPLPESLKNAGIRAVETDSNGELWVTLQQAALPYQVPTNSHDWTESEWIDSADFDPAQCYIVPTNAPANTVTEYVEYTETLPNGNTVERKGWTVVEAE